MWFMYAISWAGFLVQLTVITLSIAAGLFYLAELVEEFTVISGKIIRYINYCTALLMVCHIFFEELPTSLLVSCLLSNLMYHLVLQTFPFIQLSSPWFILSFGLLIVEHYLAFSHFTDHQYTFSEVLGFFTINLWLVPLALFVSLSASDNVLPTSITPERIDNDSDIVTSYFQRKGKKYGLLYFLKSAQDSILPQRVKKAF
ncbi:hypothetical protein HELRODRAFT_166413 [Helobdella robusta]|uniref:Protein TEX261 n=1 Tax=Helobdella robusta TaxID=6412 RepID=T1EY39_HELRO|nr:hypothetical protein HELRODRAFT_166413 [Helobdella robusta]ESN90709.1 hypothetical protein HELRODRAFT_166413 [Helobdella robusta]